MICGKCEKENSNESVFCSNCGNKLVSQVSATAVDTEILNKKKPTGKKKKIIIWTIIAVLATYYFVYFGLPFIINTPNKLTDKLSDTTWYSEPSSFVGVSTGVAFDAAYSIEFFDDGTAVMKTYACYGEKGDYDKVETIKEETVSWSVEKSCVLELGKSQYSFRYLKDLDDSGMWYFEDGKLIIGKTYYPKDKWGYSKFD